ncbi:MAG TPA: hypothetical protein VLX68_12050 [Chitinivibrionales bacterium]|nr:hypothetical protein [Chitinivibrionales bacterium]
MTRNRHIKSFFLNAAFCALFLLLPPQALFAQMFHVDSVRACSAPTVHSDTLFYTLDCYFREKPVNYWSYYDRILNAVVIEFIDNLLMAPEVTFPHNNPFKEFKAKAVETKMALSGVMTRVAIRLDKGPAGEQSWNYSMSLRTNTALRITIWKKMELSQQKMEKENRARFITSFMIGLSISVAIIAAGVIFFLNLNTASKP